MLFKIQQTNLCGGVALGGFSVKSSFNRMKKLSNSGAEIEESLLRDLKVLWKTKIPTKIQYLGWKLLQNKFPTRYT